MIRIILSDIVRLQVCHWPTIPRRFITESVSTIWFHAEYNQIPWCILTIEWCHLMYNCILIIVGEASTFPRYWQLHFRLCGFMTLINTSRKYIVFLLFRRYLWLKWYACFKLHLAYLFTNPFTIHIIREWFLDQSYYKEYLGTFQIPGSRLHSSLLFNWKYISFWISK